MGRSDRVARHSDGHHDARRSATEPFDPEPCTRRGAFTAVLSEPHYPHREIVDPISGHRWLVVEVRLDGDRPIRGTAVGSRARDGVGATDDAPDRAAGAACLLFVTASTVRRVLHYPRDWLTLGDDELAALGRGG